MKKPPSNELKKLMKKPLFTAAEARKAGIHPSRLSYYVKTQLIERIARGVYRGVDSQVDTEFQWEDLVLAAMSVPKAVVCLISALTLYELTEEIPRQHWLAISHATTKPKRDNVKFVRMRNLQTGKTNIKVGKQTITIFNVERTIIDSFRYLDKETAIKALKAAVGANRHGKLDLKKLQSYAKKFKLNIHPYLLAVTT